MSVAQNDDPHGFTVLNDKLYFIIGKSWSGYKLWATDGSVSGTAVFKELGTGTGIGNPILLSGKLFFFVVNDTNGIGLWVTDGSATGTELIIDMGGLPSAGVSLGDPVAIGNMLYFTVTYPSGNIQLWSADVISKHATFIVDKGAGTINELVAANGKLFFSLSKTGSTPYVLFYVSDGTATGTQPLNHDMMLYPDHVEMDGKLYFYAASRYTTANRQNGLWVTDGTIEGTKLVKDTLLDNCFTARDPKVISLTKFRNKLYFGCGGTEPYDNELWVSDGTTAGTYSMLNLSPSSSGWVVMYPRKLTVANDRLYFKAWNDSTRRVELWCSDGSVTGTHIVTSPTPTTSSSAGSASICNIVTTPLVIVDTTIYYTTIYDSAHTGLELYKISTALPMQTDTTDTPDSIDTVSFTFYPNPTNTSVFIDLVFDTPDNYVVNLASVDGRIKRRFEKAELAPGINKLQFPVHDLPSGVYFIQLATSKLFLKEKLAICH